MSDDKLNIEIELKKNPKVTLASEDGRTLFKYKGKKYEDPSLLYSIIENESVFSKDLKKSINENTDIGNPFLRKVFYILSVAIVLLLLLFFSSLKDKSEAPIIKKVTDVSIGNDNQRNLEEWKSCYANYFSGLAAKRIAKERIFQEHGFNQTIEGSFKHGAWNDLAGLLASMSKVTYFYKKTKEPYTVSQSEMVQYFNEIEKSLGDEKIKEIGTIHASQLQELISSRNKLCDEKIGESTLNDAKSSLFSDDANGGILKSFVQNYSP